MEVEFRYKHLDELETNASFNGGHEASIVKAFRKRMQLIRDADDERDFYNLKSLHFEKLKGNRKHQHSMCLNDQWRLVLEFKGKAPNKVVIIISIEDYH